MKLGYVGCLGRWLEDFLDRQEKKNKKNSSPPTAREKRERGDGSARLLNFFAVSFSPPRPPPIVT